MPPGEKAGRHDKLIREIINDYESQLKLDAGMQKVWFKNVLTKDEGVELIRFYCRKISFHHDVESPGVFHELMKDIGRLLFLAQTMENKK